MTAHELGRKLLEGPDLLVRYETEEDVHDVDLVKVEECYGKLNIWLSQNWEYPKPEPCTVETPSLETLKQLAQWGKEMTDYNNTKP